MASESSVDTELFSCEYFYHACCATCAEWQTQTTSIELGLANLQDLKYGDSALFSEGS